MRCKRRSVAIVDKGSNGYNKIADKFQAAGYDAHVFCNYEYALKSDFDFVLINGDSNMDDAARIRIRLYEKSLDVPVIIFSKEANGFSDITVSESRLLNSSDIVREINDIMGATSAFDQMALCQMIKKNGN